MRLFDDTTHTDGISRVTNPHLSARGFCNATIQKSSRIKERAQLPADSTALSPSVATFREEDITPVPKARNFSWQVGEPRRLEYVEKRIILLQ
jgi:hypothetical protein